MEFANHPSFTKVEPAFLIREAKRSDARDISHLLQTAAYRHLHVDWFLPGDWLGTPGFVVLTENPESKLSQAAKFMGSHEKVLGCLAAGSDIEPIAWVRAAGLRELPEPEAALVAMLGQVEAYLKKIQVTRLAWLVVEEWPRSWFEQMGFEWGNEIETYVKEGATVPEINVNEVEIRPVRRSDFETLAEMERRAFEPLWRHSVQALNLAYHQAFSFDAALIEGQVAGFQLSARSESGAHLVRLTVDPNWQGRGVGSALMHHTLSDYYRAGFHSASLNTQIDNVSSQTLYRKFGFRASGIRFPIWLKELKA